MRVWITEPDDYPASDETLAAADAAGAEQILHGIPQSLVDVVPAGTRGEFTLPEPEPEPEPVSPVLIAAETIQTEVTSRLEAGATAEVALTEGLAAAVEALRG